MKQEEPTPSLTEAVQAEFNRERQRRREHLKEIRAAEFQADEVAEAWPLLQKNLSRRIFPLMATWVKEIRAVVKPEQIRKLHKERRALERLSGITWWHPRGLWLRLRVLFYGLGLLGVGVFYLGLVVGVLALVAFMVYRLLTWWQTFF